MEIGNKNRDVEPYLGGSQRMTGVNWARGKSRGRRERNSSVEGGLGRRETFKKADAEAGGRLSRAAGEVPSGLCPVPLALQLAGLFSCVLVLSVLLWLGPLFYYLPKVSSRAGGGTAGRGGRLPTRGGAQPASSALRLSWPASTSPACARCSSRCENSLSCGASAAWTL